MKSNMKNILVVDDNLTICLMLKSWFVKNNYNVEVASNVAEAIEKVKNNMFDLVLSDIRMPDSDGFDLLSWVKKYDSSIQVIMMTSFADIDSAVESIKMGATDYIPKPIDVDVLFAKIEDAFKKNEIKKQSSYMFQELIRPEGMNTQLNHDKMIKVIRDGLHLLVVGENGTGKDTAVRFIYAKGIREKGPYELLDLNHLNRDNIYIGSLNDVFIKHFDEAKGGMLHIKGIEKIDLQMQTSLLRALTKQNRNNDYVQILMTTNKTKDQIKELLIPKLYNVLMESFIELSPIVGNESAISSYTSYFLEVANRELNKNIDKIDKEVYEVLFSHSWSGNIQELKNVVFKMALMTDDNVITKNAIPCLNDDSNCFGNRNLEVAESGMESFKKENFEKQKITEALDIAKGNKTLAATLLNIDRKTLYNKIRLYEIKSI